MTSEIEVYASSGGEVQFYAGAAPKIEDAMKTLANVQKFVSSQMVEGLDYGMIPGTKKNTLYKPGAEKIAMLFNCRDEYDIRTAELGNGHVEHVITTRLVHRATGITMATGVGSCSSMESKYRYRQGEGESTGQAVPKRYWDLKKANDFKGAQAIIGVGMQTRKIDGQWFICKPSENRVENPDIYDVRNTVLKMGKKRSKVDAAINLGCVGDKFTADLEEGHIPGNEGDYDTTSEQPRDDRPTSAKISERREQEADERKAAVNATFQPKEMAPRPWTRDEFDAWVKKAVATGNTWWTNILARKNVDTTGWPKEHLEPYNNFRIIGHLCKFLGTLVPAQSGLNSQPLAEKIATLTFEMSAHEGDFADELEHYVKKVVPEEIKTQQEARKARAEAKAAKAEPVEVEVVATDATDEDGDVWQEGRE